MSGPVDADTIPSEVGEDAALDFLHQDNTNLLREIDILRAQVDALRERNRALELRIERLSQRKAASPTTSPTHVRRATVGSGASGGDLRRTLARGSPGGSTLISSSAGPVGEVDDVFSLNETEDETSMDRKRASAGSPTQTLVLRIPRVPNISVPDVSECLAAPDVGLVTLAKCRTPEAVASFLAHLLKTRHDPQPTFRAAFEHGFAAMREHLVGCPPDWRAAMDAALPPLPIIVPASPTSAGPSTPTSQSGIATPPSTVAKGVTRATPEQLQLAWSVLLALSIAALGQRATTPLAKLPWSIKVQVVSLIPASLHRQSVQDFKVQTTEEVLKDFWQAKRTILSLKHGWHE